MVLQVKRLCQRSLLQKLSELKINKVQLFVCTRSLFEMSKILVRCCRLAIEQYLQGVADPKI